MDFVLKNFLFCGLVEVFWFSFLFFGDIIVKFYFYCVFNLGILVVLCLLFFFVVFWGVVCVELVNLDSCFYFIVVVVCLLFYDSILVDVCWIMMERLVDEMFGVFGIDLVNWFFLIDEDVVGFVLL